MLKYFHVWTSRFSTVKKRCLLNKKRKNTRVKILVPQPVCGNHSPFGQHFPHSLATTEVFTALTHHQTLKKPTSAFLKQRKSFSTRFFRSSTGFLDLCAAPPQGEAKHKSIMWVQHWAHCELQACSRVRIFWHIFCSFLHVFFAHLLTIPDLVKRHLPVFMPNTLPYLFPLINGNTCDSWTQKAFLVPLSSALALKGIIFLKGIFTCFWKNPRDNFIYSFIAHYYFIS